VWLKLYSKGFKRHPAFTNKYLFGGFMGLDAFGIGAVADLAKDLVGRFFPDKTEAEKAQMSLILTTMQNQMAMNQGQMNINKVEAASPSFFVSGWRPFVGWICGGACAWNWIGLPVCLFIATSFGKKIEVAPADLSQMLPLLLGLLGMGALRTYEKTQGVARP
jgi:hypothetical protein